MSKENKSRKHLDNLQRIQNVLDDKHEKKVQVGFSEKSEKVRKVGDKWTDSDGVEWEQKDGYRSKVSTVNKGMWETCNECEKPVTTRWDKKYYSVHGRCYYCQIDFEAILKSYPVKYFAWMRMRQLSWMDAIEKEMESKVFEMHEENKILFDKSVVNALTNENIDQSNIKL